MDSKKNAFLRLSELFFEASELFRRLATGEDSASTEENVSPGEALPSARGSATYESTSSTQQMNNDDYNDNIATRHLLAEKGVTIRHIGEIPPEAEGLLTLAGVMGQKIETIRPLLDQIKRAQSSRRRIYMDLSKQSQENIADITLVASMASSAGLLPDYRYSKSPQYKLSANAPVSPIAINFFTGQWLELYALMTIYEIEKKSGSRLYPLTHVQIELPNGDQFELDLVLTVRERLVWVEAKTTDDFQRLLPKYKAISELLCESPRDAILLWANYSNNNPLLKTRGALARMTLCAPREFRRYISDLCAGETPRGANDSELA